LIRLILLHRLLQQKYSKDRRCSERWAAFPWQRYRRCFDDVRCNGKAATPGPMMH
jgi:hypothetical protein